MNIYEFVDKLKELYPDALACAWDNDGLMSTPGGAREVTRVLVSLDATEEAVNYAAENGFDTILVHHPLIFSPLANVTPESNVARKVIFSLMNDISVVSLHTRLDAGEGGVNDCLSAALELSNVAKFGDEESPECGRIGELSRDLTPSELADHVKEKLGVEKVILSSVDEDPVRRVAVVGGAGKDFIPFAKRAGADVLVTGEASYNSMLDASENGLAVIAAGHYHTERVVLPRLVKIASDLGAECEILDFTPVKLI